MLQRIRRDETQPPPSPEAIAAGIAANVKRTAEHAALADKIVNMDAERTAMNARLNELIRANYGQDGGPAASEIRKLHRGCHELQLKIQELRMAIRPLRDEHTANVGKAMAATRADAGRTMLRGLQTLHAGAALEQACQTEIFRLGGDDVSLRLPWLGGLECYCRQLAGEGKAGR
ncbi:MAG TPA: hypothetical protein VHT02_03660 [Methylocella sp.]|jgi:hypothetical protein|nr:hypothetical protein [Methylocella sp.]